MAIFIEGEDNVQPRPQQAEWFGVGVASADGRGRGAGGRGHWRETLSKPSDATWRAQNTQNKHETAWDVTHAHTNTHRHIHCVQPSEPSRHLEDSFETSLACLCFVLMAEHGLCVNHALSDCEKLNRSMIKAYQFLNKLLQLFQKIKHSPIMMMMMMMMMEKVWIKFNKYFNKSQSGWKWRLELNKPRLISSYLASFMDRVWPKMHKQCTVSVLTIYVMLECCLSWNDDQCK